MVASAMQPMLRYVWNAEWVRAARSLVSPAPDGTVIYYQDSLSISVGAVGNTTVGLFDDGIARALCQHLTATVVKRGIDIADGPYLQLLEDDGTIPNGYVMLRALVWVGDYDLITPLTADAVSGEGVV